MASIYISYSRRDKDFAQRLTHDLEALGHQVWIDTKLESGESWRNASQEAIEQSDIFIVLISPASKESKWIMTEIDYALLLKKRLVPLLIADTDIPLILTGIQYIDARNYSSDVLQQLSYVIPAVEAAKVAPTAARQRISPRWTLISLGVILMLVISFLIFFAFNNERENDFTEKTATTALTSTPTRTAVITMTPSTSEATEEVALMVEASLTAIAEESTLVASISNPTPTPDVNELVAATVSAIRATEINSLSPAEAGEIATLVLAESRRDDRFLFFLLGTVSMLSLLILLFVSVPTIRTLRLPDGLRAISETKPEPLLEEYQVFISSSDKDKVWAKTLVKDLGELGFLVWWYAKDAPGLPFGKEIQSAIYYTKVFLIVISPDSMASPHVEEEIRWAEIFKRPIISVLHRPTPLEKYLYGLAKGAVIDFINEAEYKDAMEDLTQAINHHLKKRLQTTGEESESS